MSKPFQFSLRTMFMCMLAATTSVSVFIFIRAHPETGCRPMAAWKIVLSEAIAWALIVGVYRAWLSVGPPWSVAKSVGFVALNLYVPFCWLVLLDYPWGQYHRDWLMMWPVLPGILPEAIWFHQAGYPRLIMALGTTVLLFGLTWLATLGRAGRLAAGILTLAVSSLSSLSSWGAYWLFRF